MLGLAVPLLLRRLDVLPVSPFTDPLLGVFFEFVLSSTLQGALWRRHLGGLPLLEGGVVDFQNRLGRELLLQLLWIALLPAIAWFLFAWVPVRADEIWFRPAVIAGLAVGFVGAVRQLARLLLLKVRGSVTPRAA